MSNIIRLKDIPNGPNISGTVSVPLAELDKMRADHAKLKKITDELIAKQMQVLVIVSREMFGSSYDHRGRYLGEHVQGTKVISQEYKNLDEVKDDLKKVVADEYNNKYEKLEKEHYQLKNEHSDLKLEKDRIQDSLKNIRNELDAMTENFGKADIELTECKENIINYKAQIEDINSRLKLALEDLEKEKHKKGFWSFLK